MTCRSAAMGIPYKLDPLAAEHGASSLAAGTSLTQPHYN